MPASRRRPPSRIGRGGCTSRAGGSPGRAPRHFGAVRRRPRSRGAAFDRSQPAPPPVGDPSTGGVAAPPVVKELTDALATNNSDSLRSAVSGDPYRLLAGEIQSWNMQGVTSVQTLATMQDGPRSVTEIIITGRTAAGDPLVFNLVVHVTDNQIVNFR